MKQHDVLIIGSGGREHALAWKLRQSVHVGQLYVAPGNAGTETIAKNVAVASTDIAGLVAFVEEHDVDLTVVGTEAPLALGLADRLRGNGRTVFGPDRAGARIESSKVFAKHVMEAAGVPTAGYAVFDHADDALTYLRTALFPCVVKADGLAAGKGVFVCSDHRAAEQAVRALLVNRCLGAAGETILIEEALEGPEVSFLALVDGETVVPLPVAQDYKRIDNGDRGPNTGGMGAIAPVSWLSPEECERIVTEVCAPVATVLCEQGPPYRGVLYAGLMMTSDGPRVLEFNCRLGDPETQVILPLLRADLLPWLLAVARGELRDAPSRIPVQEQSAVGVTFAAPGYPDDPEVGQPIRGLDSVPDDLLVFHAGTARDAEGRIRTVGGRVLTVVGRGDTPEQARQRAYSTSISFDRFQMRTDIPHMPRRPFRIGVLASGDGSNLQALLDACGSGQLDAEIAVVIGETAQAHALYRAKRSNVPAFALPYTGRRRDAAARNEYDQILLDHLRPYKLNLLVLAGWMRVLSPSFLEQGAFPVINVHPALLDEDGRETLEIEGSIIPVLRGLHAVPRALELHLTVTGVTVHLVTNKVDEGPIVLRESVQIEAADCATSLYARIKPVEHRLLVRAVQEVLAQG